MGVKLLCSGDAVLDGIKDSADGPEKELWKGKPVWRGDGRGESNKDPPRGPPKPDRSKFVNSSLRLSKAVRGDDTTGE